MGASRGWSSLQPQALNTYTTPFGLGTSNVLRYSDNDHACLNLICVDQGSHLLYRKLYSPSKSFHLSALVTH